MDPFRFWRIFSEFTINFAYAYQIHYLFRVIIMNSSSVAQIQNESIISFYEFTMTLLSVTQINSQKIYDLFANTLDIHFQLLEFTVDLISFPRVHYESIFYFAN